MSRNPWVALDTGTVPVVRARELRQAWEDFVADGEVAEMREPIVESWRRSMAAGVDPGARVVAPVVAESDEAETLWEEHPLAASSDLIRACLSPIADGDGQLIVVSDANGVLLRVDGPESVRRDAAEAMNFSVGAGWSEVDAGTNAVGTALAADHAVQVFAAEHFNEVVQQWTCAAAPVRDPETADVIGVIDLTGRMRTAHPHSLACVVATSQAVHLQLTELMHVRDARLLARYEQLLAGPGERVLVSPSGRVIAGDARWIGGNRILLRPGGGEIMLPSGKLAFAEPLGHEEAYVLHAQEQRAAHGRPQMMEITLLGREQAEVKLNGRRLQVTRRQSEIVALLAGRPEGMTSEELAADLYGDAGRPGTVRVQMYRIRKLLGPAVKTDPYRIVVDVRSDWAQVQALLNRGLPREAADAYGGSLLPRSEAPGIVRERESLDAWLRQAVITSEDADALWAWVNTEAGKDDLLAWRRLLSRLRYVDPRHSLAATRVATLRQLFAPEPLLPA